jgi:3-hydroxy-9,10-secoandrosta-1,3,5(10)-triene-9,17-dione monooxygenase reductase component
MTDQTFNPGDFRKALGSFTTGVTVVTTRGTDDNDVGLTANSFNSVSLDPPMILWSLGKNALSMSHFRAAEYFAVHILSEDQESISGQFAKRGVDKFADVDIERGPGNVPLLKHCAARFICKTAHQYEGGDHLIFVGEVIDFAQWERAPLLFHSGRYGQLQKTTSADIKGGGFAEESLGYLLRLCSHQILRPLKLELAQRGFGVAQYSVLASLARYQQSDLPKLLELLAFGDNLPTEAEVDDLVRRGLIERSGNQVQLTAAGAKLHVELASIFKASESAALSALDFETRQALNIALRRLMESSKGAG